MPRMRRFSWPHSNPGRNCWAAGLVILALLVPLSSQTAQAQGFEVLYRFPTPSEPDFGVIRGSAGNLYGTTIFGGSSGWGSVFKMKQGEPWRCSTTLQEGQTDGSPLED